MNAVYRIIWSAVTQSWVVVSELATSCGKQKSSAVRTITSTVVTLAQIQCSAKSEIFVFLETSDKFSRSHVI
ncbi:MULTISPECIES: ESPR domain-containing protein [unclassified Citrobacter]|uniref:ESPR domain-containing protein n=1 Tax=Citrobacter TaxID=544 RepID=UPI00336C1CCF